jgi:hypothetical protein
MTIDDEDEQEALMEAAAVGHEATLVDDVLSADDFDGPESFEDRSRHEEPDFDEQLPPDDHLRGTLLAPDQGGNDRDAELVANELPAEGPLSPEEAAVHRITH